MDIVSSLLMFAKEYGIPLVLLVLVLWWLVPKLDEAWRILMDRARDKPEIKYKDFDKVLEIDIDLNSLLIEALHEAESDYVTMWQFHNGAISFGGIPFQRISVTHQQIRSGYVGWGHDYQNLPTSLFVACKAFRNMIGNNVCAKVCCNESEGNETMIGILQAHDIKKMFVCPIRDSSNTLIALITFSYVVAPDTVVETNSRCEFAKRACVLLELQARLSKED